MNNTKKNHLGKTLVAVSLSLSVAMSGSMLVTTPSALAASVSNVFVADNVIATGKQFLGTPYQFGAKSGRTDVFDGSSFTQYVYKQNGINLPRSSRQQANVGAAISKDQLQPGDLVFSDTNRDGVINYVGIYLGDGKLLHTYKVSVGVTISDFAGSPWDKTFVTARRVIPNNGQASAILPKPVIEAPKPVVEAPTPVVEAPKPAVEAPTPVVEAPKPAVEAPTPVVVAPTPAAPVTSVADKIFATGKQFLGVRYQFAAKAGSTDAFDCSSFTQYVFKQNGINIPRSSRQQATAGTFVPKNQLQAGDLVFSDTNRDGVINHVGIYMGDGKVLHTYRVGIGVTISNFNGSTWDKTFVTARRVIS